MPSISGCLGIGLWSCLALLPTILVGQNRPQPAPPQAPPVPAAAPAMPAVTTPNVAPRFIVVLDAAHGGDDTGARISSTVIEKDITLSLSVRLRSTLSAHGIGVVTTREADANLSANSRAEAANRTPAAACILIHATATGSGVHIYTSSLAPAAGAQTRFLPWQTAQAAYVTQSLKLSSEIDSALAHAEIPVTLGRTALQPMDSFACPAVAVEIAPLAAGTTTRAQPISDSSYQRSILDALTAAIDEWRNQWRQQP